MTRLLALDASGEACSVALWQDGAVTGYFEHAPRQQSRRLMPMIETVLAEAGLVPSDLDALAYGHGPGSFTGIRIAAGTAQGLAWGIDRPLLGISTLEALALGAHLETGARLILPALDARMGELYSAFYRIDDGRLERLGDERVQPLAQLTLPPLSDDDTLLGVGSGWQLVERFPQGVRARATTTDTERAPDAAYLVRLAATSFNAGHFKAISHAIPVYLRNQVTTR